MTDAAPSSAPDRTFRLIYRSRCLIPQDRRKVELGTLFSQARSFNKHAHITGALLISDDWFVQTLEGEEAAVRTVFEKISKDPRHDSVALLDTRVVDDRVFARWAMAKVADEGEPDIPLIAHTDGISPAAGRGTTPEQETILDTMREAARGDSHAVER